MASSSSASSSFSPSGPAGFQEPLTSAESGGKSGAALQKTPFRNKRSGRSRPQRPSDRRSGGRSGKTNWPAKAKSRFKKRKNQWQGLGTSRRNLAVSPKKQFGLIVLRHLVQSEPKQTLVACMAAMAMPRKMAWL